MLGHEPFLRRERVPDRGHHRLILRPCRHDGLLCPPRSVEKERRSPGQIRADRPSLRRAGPLHRLMRPRDHEGGCSGQGGTGDPRSLERCPQSACERLSGPVGGQGGDDEGHEVVVVLGLLGWRLGLGCGGWRSHRSPRSVSPWSLCRSAIN
jgi:hypothetical protein